MDDPWERIGASLEKIADALAKHVADALDILTEALVGETKD